MYSQVTYLTSTTSSAVHHGTPGVLNVLSTPVIQGLIQALSELAETKSCIVLC